MQSAEVTAKPKTVLYWIFYDVFMILAWFSLDVVSL